MIHKYFYLISFFFLSFISLRSQSSQIIVAQFKDENGKWGYIDNKGKIILPAIYSSSSKFCYEGVAIVQDSQTGQYKYIDINGKEIKLNFQAEELKPFYNGRAAVKINNKWGFIDINGNLVISNIYNEVEPFNSNRSFVIDDNNNMQVIDLLGNYIDISKHKVKSHKTFSEGLAPVKIKSKWGFIDTTGKLSIDAKYLNIGKFSGGFAWVRLNSKDFTFINKKGEIILSERYLFCREFDPISGMARVKSKNGWFYIDNLGKKLFINADHHFDFWGGLCKADTIINPGIYGFKNNKGIWAIGQGFKATKDFHNGICAVRDGGYWGAIDENGYYVIDPKYNGLEDFVVIKNNTP